MLAFPIGYNPTDAIAPGKTIAKLLNFSEFKDPLSGFRFQAHQCVKMRLVADGRVADAFERLHDVVLPPSKVVVESDVLGVQLLIDGVRSRIRSEDLRLELRHLACGRDDVVVAALCRAGRQRTEHG